MSQFLRLGYMLSLQNVTVLKRKYKNFVAIHFLTLMIILVFFDLDPPKNLVLGYRVSLLLTLIE